MNPPVWFPQVDSVLTIGEEGSGPQLPTPPFRIISVRQAVALSGPAASMTPPARLMSPYTPDSRASPADAMSVNTATSTSSRHHVTTRAAATPSPNET